MATKYLNLDTDPEFTANSDYRISSQKAVKTAVDKKQDKLSAGNGIKIENNEISANVYLGNWNSSTTYYPGNIVRSEGIGINYYICLIENTNDRPTINGNNWGVLSIPSSAIFTATGSNVDYPIVVRSQNSTDGTTNYGQNLLCTSATKSPTINTETGRMKIYGGIEGYYTSTEIDEKFQSIDQALAAIIGEN